jgi:hypothetical protein
MTGSLLERYLLLVAGRLSAAECGVLAAHTEPAEDGLAETEPACCLC